MIQRTQFADQDELVSLLKGGSAEFFQKGPGAFQGEFTYIPLESGSLQVGRMSLPYLSRGASSIERPGFLLHLKLGGEWLSGGRVLNPRSVFHMAPHAEIQCVTPPNSTWAFLSFDRARLERMLARINGGEPSLISHGIHLFLPQADSFERLRRRLLAIVAEASADPFFPGDPVTRREVEESILTSLARALGSATHLRPESHGLAARARSAKRVEAFLSASPNEPLYLADLCAVAGVSERTLRNIFQDFYQMSPVRYLKLRRLHQVRRALRRADPDLNTVQSIARRWGVLHLGRFASEYRALFGEAPLETLKRSAPHAAEAHRIPGAPPMLQWPPSPKWPSEQV
jgi:AraC family transcriptional regulator, ethanolamine operon transcriptional activator